MNTLTLKADNLLFTNLLNTKIEEYSDLLAYLHQMPGLETAINIGRQAKVYQHLTVVEMCATISLVLNTFQVDTIDDAMAKLAAVVMMTPQSYRVSTVGGCSYEVREYPGCMFPLFLNVLHVHGFYND